VHEAHLCRRAADNDSFLGVQLVKEPLMTKVERATGDIVFRAALWPVMETPARGSPGQCTTEVGQDVCRGRVSIDISPAKRFLVMHRRNSPQLFHHRDALASLGIGLCG
jgi:hypothetical protein